MSKCVLIIFFFVYSYSLYMLKRVISSFGNLVVRKRIFSSLFSLISMFFFQWLLVLLSEVIGSSEGNFPSLVFGYFFFFFFAGKFIFNSKILSFDPIATSIFGYSLDLSKLNWIKINTITNSSQIVSKISFLSWVASLRLLFFELKHLKRKLWGATQETGLSICWHEYPWTLEILPVCVVQSCIAYISKSPVKVREKSVCWSLQEQPQKDRATFKNHM